MISDNFKGYLRQKRSVTTISVFACMALYFVLKDKAILLIFIGIGLLDFIKGFSDYKKRQEYLSQLVAIGLTEQEADNNLFVTKWEKTRAGGLLKFCLLYGIVLMGGCVAMFITFIVFLIYPSFFGAPGNFIQAVEIISLSGALLGIVLSFFMWSLNEKKFTRLKALLH